jgi:hypothetical protein
MGEPWITDQIRSCTHQESICVISDGLERVVCEGCGDVIIRYESMISGDISRSQFAREADALHETPVSGEKAHRDSTGWTE